MLLRWLVNQYVGQAARQQVQNVVTQTLREFGTQSQRPSPGAEEEPVNESDRRTQSPPPEELAPPCDLIIAFALGVESGGTIDLLEHASTTRVGSFTEHAGKLRGKEAVVVETGVGGPSAAQAVSDAIDFHQPLWLISAGFAGALDPALRRGHILMASEVVRAGAAPLSIGVKVKAEGNRGLHTGRLVSVDKLIRTRGEKESLAKEFQALACDMETYQIADVCRQKNVRFLSVRIVSDALDDELPKEVERLLSQKTFAGKLGAAAQAVFQRPGSALDLFKLQDEALKASDRLAKFLAGMVVQLES